jgi:hypothetical protein
MELIAINRAMRAPGELHDAAYDMQVKPEWDDEKGMLHLRVTKEGKAAPLALVHGELMHVIVISEDLAYFDHVHPVVEEDGFALTYRFPRDGRYVMYFDVTPKGDREQVFRRAMGVSHKTLSLGNGDAKVYPGQNWKAPTLEVDKAGSKLVYPVTCGATPQTQAPLDKDEGGRARQPAREPVMVELVSEPRTLYAGLHSQLLFKLSDAQGRPLTDLGPYIGAMGHCVIVSEDSEEYLHSHPEQLNTPGPEDRGGPVVAFHAVFPKAGRYRVWGQFRRPARTGQGNTGGVGDDLIIADFTVEVHTSLVPAKVVNFLVD